MTTQKLYQRIAQLVCQNKNCVKANNTEWDTKPEMALIHAIAKRPTAFCDRNGYSSPAWKTLAIRLADEALTCLNNSHWEVKFGSGDLLNTIRAIQALKDSESK